MLSKMIESTYRSSYTVLFSVIWMLLSLAIFYINVPNTDFIHMLLTMLIIISYFFILLRWIRTGNRLVSLFSLFVLFSLFYNLGQSFLYSYTDFPLMWSIYEMYSLNDICYMLKYHLICSSGFYLGIAIYTNNPTNNLCANVVSDYYRNVNLPKGNFDDIKKIILVISFVVLYYYAIKQVQMRQSMDYFELMSSREIVSEFFSFFSIVLGLYFIFKRQYVKIIIVAWLFLLLLYIIAGTRSMSIVYLAALLFVFPIYKPNIFERRYLILWLMCFILCIISVSILSTVRQSSLSDTTFSNNDILLSLYTSINEMGISQTPTITTINWVEHNNVHPQTILYNLLMGIFPADILKGIIPHEWTNAYLGHWVTEQEFGSEYSYQLGYSWLAEAYLNYGQFAWIFTAFYGYIIASLENMSIKKIMKGELIVAVCIIAILCKQIFFARCQLNNFMQFYKPSIYILLFVIIFKKTNKYL